MGNSKSKNENNKHFHCYSPPKEKETIYINFCNSKPINKYLNFYTKRSGTHKIYKQTLRDFFYWLNEEDIDSFFKDPSTMENGDKIKYLYRLEDKILEYTIYLSEKYSSSSPINIFLSCMKKLLQRNHIELLNTLLWEDLRKANDTKDKQTPMETPNKEKLKKIIEAGNTETKAMFLMQMTSGSRISEIITLSIHDLKLGYTCPRFTIRPENSKSRYAIRKRCSPETKYWLEKYIPEKREKNIQRRKKRTKTTSKVNYDDLLFPMALCNANQKWRNMVKNAGFEYKIDPKTKRPITCTHCLRRYFNQNFTGYEDTNTKKILMDHLSKVERAYLKDQSEEKLDEDYQKGVSSLYIEQTDPNTTHEISELQNKISDYEAQLEKLENSKEILITRDEERDKTQNDFEKTIKEYDKRLKDLEYNFTKKFNINNPELKKNLDKAKEYIKHNYHVPEKDLKFLEEHGKEEMEKTINNMIKEAQQKNIPLFEYVNELMKTDKFLTYYDKTKKNDIDKSKIK